MVFVHENSRTWAPGLWVTREILPFLFDPHFRQTHLLLSFQHPRDCPQSNASYLQVFQARHPDLVLSLSPCSHCLAPGSAQTLGSVCSNTLQCNDGPITFKLCTNHDKHSMYWHHNFSSKRKKSLWVASYIKLGEGMVRKSCSSEGVGPKNAILWEGGGSIAWKFKGRHLSPNKLLSGITFTKYTTKLLCHTLKCSPT